MVLISAFSDRVVRGAFRQFGIQRAFDDEELCDAAKALATLPVPEGNRTAIISPAGGYGVMLNIELSDLGRALDTMMLRFPDYDILLKEQVQFTGPEFILGAVNDPDYGVSIMAGAGGIMTEN